MLRVIAYDVGCPRRLRRIAKICEDYGKRVQFSLFECWLEKERLDRLWEQLESVVEPQHDRLICYTLDATGVRKRLTAGETMTVTEKQSALFL